MTSCPHCGCDIGVTDSKRSVPHLRRYFALIRAAFHHWPEAHAVQFVTEEEFRKWVQMKAGHREVGARIPLIGLNKDRAVALAEAAIRAAGSYAVPVMHGNDLVVFVPKSIAFGKLSHLAACDLFNSVAEVITAETGLDCEQLLREKAA
jgi:hypothetical protein